MNNLTQDSSNSLTLEALSEPMSKTGILVVIDPNVEAYPMLAATVVPGAQVLILDPNRDGVEQISEILAKSSDVRAVHIVSHGAPGCLYLGNSQLSLESLKRYASQLETWFTCAADTISPCPTVVLYGCHVAATEVGEEFIARLHNLTRADIAASKTPTGSTARGGNWELEVSTGGAKVPLAFEAVALCSYRGLLGDVTRVFKVASSYGNQLFSYTPTSSISVDGRYVAYQSSSVNPVSNWHPSAPTPLPTFTTNIFVYDREIGTTQRVSSGFNPSISADGRYVAFHSNDIFVYDQETGTTSCVSLDSTGNQGNDKSYNPSISADGRYVAFTSLASNLVSEDTNNFADIFVYDQVTGTTTSVSLDSTGNQANGSSSDPSISVDGRYVVFASAASNLVLGDTNNFADIFVYDRETGTTTRVSLDSTGNEGNNNSSDPSISANGHYVVFTSVASNLVPGDTNNATDIFVYDQETGTTTRVSVDSTGNQGNGNSYNPSISADGRYLAFGSVASNLVPGDTNYTTDTFVYDRETGMTSCVSLDSPGLNFSSSTSISADASYVGFSSNQRIVQGGSKPSEIIVSTDLFVAEFTPSNTPPVANNDIVTTFQNTAVTIPVATLLANDTDADGDSLSVISVINAANGSAVLNNNGTLSNRDDDYIVFTPNNGFSGDASFVCNIGDSHYSMSQATVSVAVGTVQYGGYGEDLLNGNSGNDQLSGSYGKDTLIGSAGDDSLVGGNGADELVGGDGNDLLIGGNGADTLTGDNGSDIFVLGKARRVDTITDFSLGQGDKIGLTDGLTFNNLTFVGNEIHFGHKLLATLSGFDTTLLTASDFVTV